MFAKTSIWTKFTPYYDFKNMSFSLYLISAFVLDAIAGDPRWFPHPVRAIGWLCVQCEGVFCSRLSNKYLGGLATVIIVLGVTFCLFFFLLLLAHSLHTIFETVLAIFVLYTTIAMKDLLTHSRSVYLALESLDVETARVEVGKIVGRDTTKLDSEGIAKACVETVAENMVDGITAPLFFALVASFLAPLSPLSAISCAALGAITYKAVNTLDSMIGYKNERYLLFGRAAAKLDDLANYLPARLSGLCLIFAAFLLKFDYKNSAKLFARDRLNHSSPNAAHSEAAVAGAFGIQLGGPSVYFGKVVEKPFIGDRDRAVTKDDILGTNKIIAVGSIIFLIAGLVFKTVL